MNFKNHHSPVIDYLQCGIERVKMQANAPRVRCEHKCRRKHSPIALCFFKHSCVFPNSPSFLSNALLFLSNVAH